MPTFSSPRFVTTEGKTLLRTRFDEAEGQVSPDGRWLACVSDESGRLEVYVQPFPGGGERYQVSASGGITPRWAKDGRELFFMTQSGEIAAVRVTGNASRFACSIPRILFRVPGLTASVPAFRTAYAVADDGRFLINVNPTDHTPATITALVHWQRQ